MTMGFVVALVLFVFGSKLIVFIKHAVNRGELQCLFLEKVG